MSPGYKHMWRYELGSCRFWTLGAIFQCCTEMYCGFCSPRTKLYKEVNTKGSGRKAAVGNVRLHVLLQDMPIGPTELQLIFAAVGLRAGSLPRMQKLSYKASLATEEVADTDMIKWREHTKKVLADRGVNNPDEICAAFDVRYQDMFKASCKTPGPWAPQATATCVDSDATEEMYSYWSYQQGMSKGLENEGQR